MASKQDQTPPPRRPGRASALIALLVLAGLAAAALAVFFYREGRNPPPPAAAPAAPLAAARMGPQFDIVRVDPQGNTVVAGRAAPGAAVTVLDNGKPIGRVTADAQGAFVLVPQVPLAPGAHEITLSEKRTDGTSVAGGQSVSVNLPGNGGAALAVLSGPGGSKVLSGQGPQAGTLGLGTVDYDTSGHAIFSGTAPAGAKITLSLGGKTLGSTVADAAGHWRIAAATPAASGTLVLNATTAGGAALAPVAQPFAPETLRTALEQGHVVIAPGDNLWMIARRVYGKGTMYTLIYGANSGKIKNPNLIFPGQDFVLPRSEAN